MRVPPPPDFTMAIDVNDVDNNIVMGEGHRSEPTAFLEEVTPFIVVG